MPIRFSPECFVDSTPGEIVEFVVRCNVATSWPLCRRPTQHQHLLRHHLLQPSPPYLVIVLGNTLTRRCAPAGITEGVDERVVNSTTSFAVEIAPPHRRRLLPSRSTSTTREVSFARAWLSLGDDARRRGRRLHERDAASLFGTRMTSGCRSSFLREACKNRGSMVGVHLHGARGGQKH